MKGIKLYQKLTRKNRNRIGQQRLNPKEKITAVDGKTKITIENTSRKDKIYFKVIY